MNFPIFKTKIKGKDEKFNLADPQERKKYFEVKAGPEIEKLKKYLGNNTFIAYLLGKKNSGKGTYSKLFMEIFGQEKVVHISIGDVVRKVDKDFSVPAKKKELLDFLEKNYRGYIPLDKVIESLLKRDTRSLLPTEFILALFKREIDNMEKKSLFIDGFPRDLDQISYSLFFRDLVDYRQDADIFVLIDVSEAVIDERIKYRRVCPVCGTPRNLKLYPTEKIGYDKNTKEFYLICDNFTCQGKEIKMVSKEGDELGIEPIRDRLTLDGKLIEQAFSLHGIPKVFLRNSIPVAVADEYVDNYELTPEYSYQWDSKEEKVKIFEKPWTIADDKGIDSYSLMAAPVVVSMIKQLVKKLVK